MFYFDIFSKIRVAEKTGKNPWTDRSPPSLLLLNVVLKETSSTEKTDSSTHPDQVVWSLKENAEKFLVSATKLKLRSEKGFLEFEKDDKEIMDFVTAASNIRSYIFGIPLQSKFSVKCKKKIFKLEKLLKFYCLAMAGNIIPAIATTNAIIAGLIVIEAIKVLQKKNESLRMISFFFIILFLFFSLTKIVYTYIYKSYLLKEDCCFQLNLKNLIQIVMFVLLI